MRRPTRGDLLPDSGLRRLLKSRRLQLGITCAEVADLSGVSQSGYYQIESGVSIGRPDQLVKIAHGLAMNPADPLWEHICGYLRRHGVDPILLEGVGE